MARISLAFILTFSIAASAGVAEAQTRQVEKLGLRAPVDWDELAFGAEPATSAYGQGGDADGDGVPDPADVCDDTPAGTVVDSVGRPLGDLDADCDTDLDDYGLFLQGFTGPLDPVDDHSCNPVAQTGCDVGEKCTFVPDDVNPLELRTVCRADGTVPSGGACTIGPVTGVDDCVAGQFCWTEVCGEVCSAAPDSCPSGRRCEVIAGLLDSPGVGECVVPCNPLSDPSGCSSGEACYLVVSQETTVCGPPMESETQGDACQYMNGCATGYSCALNDSPGVAAGLVCAFVCDASRSGGPTCAEGPGATFRCAQLNLFYPELSATPDEYGICIDPVEWSIFDEDGDTVLDFNDLCPGTPKGTPVNEDGCPL